MYDDYLYHHGIKGQKWGVRRYQNEDGSYTDEGKRRRGDGMSRGKKIGIGAGVAAGIGGAAAAANRIRQLSRPRLQGAIRTAAYSERVMPKALPPASQEIVRVGSQSISSVPKNSMKRYGQWVFANQNTNLSSVLGSPYVAAGAAALAAAGVGAYAYRRYKKNKNNNS